MSQCLIVYSIALDQAQDPSDPLPFLSIGIFQPSFHIKSLIYFILRHTFAIVKQTFAGTTELFAFLPSFYILFTEKNIIFQKTTKTPDQGVLTA